MPYKSLALSISKLSVLPLKLEIADLLVKKDQLVLNYIVSDQVMIISVAKDTL